MTTIMLEVPDELAQKLQQFESSILIELLTKLIEIFELLLTTPLKPTLTDKPPER